MNNNVRLALAIASAAVIAATATPEFNQLLTVEFGARTAALVASALAFFLHRMDAKAPAMPEADSESK